MSKDMLNDFDFSKDGAPAQPLPDGTYEPVLTKEDLDRCGRRWNMGTLTFNYQTQLAPTVLFAQIYALRKIYRGDPEGFKRSLENCMRYFNVTPPVAGLLLGATLAMEDKQHNAALEAVNDLKVGLMGSLSGIGDTILWTLIPTIMGSVAAYMAQNGNAIGVVLWVLLDIAIFIWKIGNWKIGYKFGTALITSLADKVAVFTEAMSILGLTVVGALIPSVVVVNLGLTFTMGEVSFNIQESVLNPIMLGLLPVALTALVYALMKKKVNFNFIILGIIVICWVCAAFGILV